MNTSTQYLVEHEKEIKKSLQRFRLPKEDIEDIFQDLYIKLEESKSDANENLSGYVKTAATNNAIEYLRKYTKRTIPVEYYDWDGDAVALTPESLISSETTEDKYIEEETLFNQRKTLQSLVQLLPKTTREIIKEYLTGKHDTIVELAKSMNRNENATKHMVMRARQAMENRVKEQAAAKAATIKITKLVPFKKKYDLSIVGTTIPSLPLRTKVPLTKELLETDVQSMSIRQIARKYGLAKCTIMRKKKKWGIK